MKIPKILHSIWLGGEPMPILMIHWLVEWRRLHQGWEHYEWREQRCRQSGDALHLHLATDEICTEPAVEPTAAQLELLNRACNLAQRANIWRYLVVAKFGGIYADTDIEPIRTIEDLVGEAEAFAARRAGSVPVIYENAFFGAIPGHPWLLDVLKWLPHKHPGIPLSMGVELLTEVSRRHPEVVLLPEDKAVFVPPLDWTRAKSETSIPEADTGRKAHPDAFIVHHWGSLWHKKGFEPIATKEERHG